MFSIEEARVLLRASGVFFEDDPEDKNYEDYDPKWAQTINMSDTWAWACADAEPVSNEELPEVATLFFRYGWCGILYWVSEKRDVIKSQFFDINRFVEFARREEEIRKEEPDSNRRAFLKKTYCLG